MNIYDPIFFSDLGIQPWEAEEIGCIDPLTLKLGIIMVIDSIRPEQYDALIDIPSRSQGLRRERHTSRPSDLLDSAPHP
jgi:hypothetical protein